jgi:hypothetical protein
MSDHTYDPDDTFLTDLLTRYWQLDSREIACSRYDLKAKNYTISQVAEHYLRKIAPEILGRNLRDDGLDALRSVPSVASMVGRTLVRSLMTGELTPDYVLCEVFSDETPVNMRMIGRWILSSGRLPYHLLCAFLCRLSSAESPKWVQEGNSRIPTLDDAIALNEAYLRSRTPEENKDGVYLVTLDQLQGNIKSITETVGKIDRSKLRDGTTIPPGGFEILDHRRPTMVELNMEDSEVMKTFHRITRNILRGLDWTNVFVAGSVVLTSLTHTEPSKDHYKSVRDSDINVYLYGLDFEAANSKVEEIYKVWRRNLPFPRTIDSQLVFKSAESITFFSEYPTRRVQIILKLFSSPTDVLLSFDLDPCAVGIDGERVYILPRCARALETGYSVFTTDWLNASALRYTTHQRFLKYASRGYGVRILPSYITSLEKDYDCETSEVGWNQRLDRLWADEMRRDKDSRLPYTMQYGPIHFENSRSRTAYRLQDFLHTKLNPGEEFEPGLKTLKRIAYLGWDFVNRFCYENTPLTFPSPAALLTQLNWEPDYEKRKDMARTRSSEGPTGKDLVRLSKHPDVVELVTRLIHCDFDINPDERMGHQTFEDFTRLAEAWRLAEEIGLAE